MNRRCATAPASVLAIVFAGGAVGAIALWLPSGPQDMRDLPRALVGVGRVTGLLGAYAALVQLVLLSRLPILERMAGLDRRVAWHRPAAMACLGLLCAHAVSTTVGYALGDRLGLASEIGRLVTGYPGVLAAVVGLGLLIAVAVTSAGGLRRRLRYETWQFTHLYAYVAVALAYSHQLATGSDFVGAPTARLYWISLYVVTGACLLAGRVAVPALRASRHRLRVVRVLAHGPTVTSVEISGRRLDRLGARSGQFFTWRFLTREHWWEAHPFSLSAAPDGQRVRITVKGLGDFSSRLGAIAPGTRVIAEGPFGSFTAAGRRCARVVLIAGGAGITPIRALLEDMPGGPGEIAVVYRAARAEDLILREELDDLAARRGAEVHYLLGASRDPSGESLRRLVPDIVDRDVYVCGPPEMTRATRASLREVGVPRRQINVESFTL